VKSLPLAYVHLRVVNLLSGAPVGTMGLSRELDRQFLKSALMQDAILDALAKGRRPKVKR
jgi:hypothetical protein